MRQAHPRLTASMARFGRWNNSRSCSSGALKGGVRLKLRIVALTAAALSVLSGQAQAQMQLTVLHSFNRADGFGPMAGVTQGPDGALYGTASQGVALNLGTVFRLDAATAALTTLHDFAGTDGALPYAGVCPGSDGLLYGTTFAGGTADLGTLFHVGLAGANFATLYQFSGLDGGRPDDLVLTQAPAPDGGIYGATSKGGAGGGTLFCWESVGSVLTTTYSFPGTVRVDAGLMRGKSGGWYGTTYSGGAAGVGSIFAFDPSSGTVTTLHDFTGSDGMYPVPGALMQASDGMLYGTTQLGGYGTVYQLNPVTQAFATIHAFSGVNDGRSPLGGLTEAADGYLYGTTAAGGGVY